MSSSERVKRYRIKQKEQGRLKREMYLTDSELLIAKKAINDSRKNAKDS